MEIFQVCIMCQEAECTKQVPAVFLNGKNLRISDLFKEFVVQRIVSVQKMQEVGKFFRAFEPIDMDERHIRRDFCVGCRRRSKHNRYKAVASNYEWLVK